MDDARELIVADTCLIIKYVLSRSFEVPYVKLSVLMELLLFCIWVKLK